MNAFIQEFSCRPEILESILSSNSSELIKKCLKRLKLPTEGTKLVRLKRMAEYLSTNDGKNKAYQSNIST